MEYGLNGYSEFAQIIFVSVTISIICVIRVPLHLDDPGFKFFYFRIVVGIFNGQ